MLLYDAISPASIEGILDHPAHHPASSDLVELKRRVREVKKACSILLGMDIPQTLVHGDFDSMNFRDPADEGKEMLVIDWATACITPFLRL